jgi:hypothetical protein
LGARPAAIARRRWVSRGGAQREHAGLGPSWPSGLGFGRGQAWELARNTVNTSRRSRKRFRVRVGVPHGGGGSGSRWQGEHAHAEGERKGEGARHDPYHAWKLRRRLAVEKWRCRGGIATARARSTAALPSGQAAERRREAWGKKLGKAEAAEGEHEEAVAAKKGGAVLGVRVVHATASAPPADAWRLDLIQARPCFWKQGKVRGLASGVLRVRGRKPRVRRSGATGSGRAAGRRRRKQRRGRRRGERGRS